MKRPTFNILMYSHDTYGLGHIRRTMAIAAKLREPDVNILILTGSPLAGRFLFPEQVDFVRIPGMIKKTNDLYLPHSIRIDPQHALEIRKSIIKATAQTFQPQLFIVDKEPMGLKKEVLSTLEWLRGSMPGTRTILGLRDIMDDGPSVRAAWKKKGIYDVLKELYSEIWVYGDREFYDPIQEYDIPESIRPKIYFTGYIPRQTPSEREAKLERKRNRIPEQMPLVVVTAGGGGDGYPVMDAYLAFLENEPQPPPFCSLIITGPFMPKELRRSIISRAKRVGVLACHFYRQMEKVLAAADLVITMGGYNTLCEILSLKKVALVIPRETPRREQLIRAQCFRRHNLADYIPWRELTPESLRYKVFELLESPGPFREAIAAFRMTGFDVMRERIRLFRRETP